MRRGFGACLFLILGLAILFSMPTAANCADWGSPQIEVIGRTPVQNNDLVMIRGSGFNPGETIAGFGAVVQILNEGYPQYRGFNLPQLSATTNALGEFQLDVPLDMLTGIHGHIEIALYRQDTLIFTDQLLVYDRGIYQPLGLDATAGTLYFADFAHGGSGEDPVVNSDDIPMTSNGQGDWDGTLFQVNLERHTTTDGTGTSTPVNSIDNDVTFTSGNLDATSSGVVEGLSATYKSIRMTVLVWDVGNYTSIRGTTTTGTGQGTGWLSTDDTTAPQVSSAQATDLTTIVVTFSESVTTPADNADAIDNWTVTFGGAKAVSALTPLGSSGTTTVTLTVADLGDRGATPTVQFTTGTNEFEDSFGNDCASTISPHITATDGIAPATPTLDTPISTTMMTGASMQWTASAGAGTDNSLAGMELQGSDNGTTWDSLGVDTSVPYGNTYTFGTEYTYYRVQAYDTGNNTANSSSSVNFQDAFRLNYTTIPASTQVSVESGQWEFTVEDNYGNPENVTQTVGLSTSSTGGTFRAVSGGPAVGSINLNNASTGNFYYIDTVVGTPQLIISNVTLQNDTTDYQITSGAASKILVKLPSQGFTNGTGITGTPDFGSYGGSSNWAEAGSAFPVRLIIVDANNNIILTENGSRDIDFTTTASDAPDGTTPIVNSTTFPASNISVAFTEGESAGGSVTITLYDFTQDYNRVSITASDNSGSPTLTGSSSTAFYVMANSADHIDWTNSSGVVTTTPVNTTPTAGSAVPTLYVSALDAYDNRDTTYTGSTITTTGGSSSPPTNSPSGTYHEGANAPSGNTAPDYGTNSSWSNGTVTLLSTNADQRTIISAATTSGFMIRALATNGTLNGQYTPNSDLFDVNYSTHNYVRVEDTSGGGGTEFVNGHSLTTAESNTYWAISYDVYGNVREDKVVTWSSTNLTPSASGTSTYWTFSPTAANAGNGTLTADAPTGTDRTITGITVTADATIASVKIRTASGGGGSETGAMEIGGASNGGNYNLTDWMYAAGYNEDEIYVSDVSATWAITDITGGSFENVGAASSNRYTASSVTNQTGYITITYDTFTDSTGLVTVDATKPATPSSFNVTEDNENHYYVWATWSSTSSYDDGSSAASGYVEDFDVRWSASVINNETAWDNATSVGTTSKPSSFNTSSTWHIYMASFPSGYYYYAIKTLDDQGYWSDIGSGCYTTTSDFSLPVTLTTFQARGSYGKILLNWSTESEIDALGFRLYRDTNENLTDPILVASYQTDTELQCQGSGETGFDYSFTDRQDLDPDVTYYYALESVDVNGRVETADLQASAEIMPLPSDYSLGPNFPNPFNPATQFELRLPVNGEVSLIIYDMLGREVNRIINRQYLEADVYQFTWKGTNAQGMPMPSGLYFCRLQANDAQRIMKMMLLK